MKDTVRNDKENVLELKNKMVGRISAPSTNKVGYKGTSLGNADPQG